MYVTHVTQRQKTERGGLRTSSLSFYTKTPRPLSRSRGALLLVPIFPVLLARQPGSVGNTISDLGAIPQYSGYFGVIIPEPLSDVFGGLAYRYDRVEVAVVLV